MNQKELTKTIETVYPFKVVSNLKNFDETLYSEVSKAAKDKKTSIKVLVENLGFKYSRKAMGEICAEDYETLIKMFPEKNIELLSDVDLKLYYKLLSHAKLINMDIKKYLAFLGFNYLVQKEEITKESIKAELTGIYKNKKITKLSVNQPQLYNKIYKLAQKENISITKLVEDMGFSIDLEENYKNNRRKNVNKNVKKIKNSTAKISKKNEKNSEVFNKTNKNNKEKALVTKNTQKVKSLNEIKGESIKRKVGRPKKNELKNVNNV